MKTIQTSFKKLCFSELFLTIRISSSDFFLLFLQNILFFSIFRCYFLFFIFILASCFSLSFLQFSTSVYLFSSICSISNDLPIFLSGLKYNFLLLMFPPQSEFFFFLGLHVGRRHVYFGCTKIPNISLPAPPIPSISYPSTIKQFLIKQFLKAISK